MYYSSGLLFIYILVNHIKYCMLSHRKKNKKIKNINVATMCLLFPSNLLWIQFIYFPI